MSVTTALPWSAPEPGRTSTWVEEISWCGLGTVTNRGWSVEVNRRASGARPISTARSTSTVSPLENTSRATGCAVTLGACGWPGMPGCCRANWLGSQPPATVLPSWSSNGGADGAGGAGGAAAPGANGLLGAGVGE